MSSRRDFIPSVDELQDLRIRTHIVEQVEDQMDDLISLLAAEQTESPFPATQSANELDDAELDDVELDPLIEADAMHESQQAVDFSFVLPCLNQAHELADSILRIQFALERIDRQGEILVVDFGSSDDSQQIASELGANVIQRSADTTLGLERLASREVLSVARGQVVVLTDCKPETIDRWF